jgi:hypothetical protein
MPNEEGAPAPGEATPPTSPVETTEPGQPTKPGENPPNPSGQKPETSQFVPYERFKEVNNKLRALEEQNQGLAPKLETLDRLQDAFNPQDVDPSEFNSPEEYTQFLSQKFEQQWRDREKALETKVMAGVNARYELESLKQEYPELKDDSKFRNIVVTQMALNPDKSPREIVKEAKDYLETVKEAAKKQHEEEFLNKGTYSGKPGNNHPYESDDADEIRKGIIGAGAKGGIF